MKKLFYLSFIFFISLSAEAQTATTASTPMSLQQCIDYALTNQPALQNAALDAEIAHRRVQEITGLAYPQVSGSIQAQDFLKLPTSLIPAEFFGGEPGTFIPVQFGTQYNATATASVSQLIEDPRYFLGLSATRALSDLSSLNVDRTKVETIEQVTKAYYSSLISKKRLAELDANITSFKKLFDDTKVMYQNGFVEKLDVDRLQVTYNNLLTEKDKTAKLVALSDYLLKFQMGMDVNQTIALTDSISEGNFETDLQGASKPDVNNRIEYQILQTSRSLAQMDIRRHQLEYIPTLYGFGSFSYQSQRNDLNFFSHDPWYPTAIVGLQLNIPIFDGFQKARLIQETKLTLKKNENDISNFENAMNLQLASAKTNLENSIASLNTQRDNLKLAEEVVTITNKKYQLGVGSSLELTDAETSLKDAQTNYLNALYDAWIARVDLKKALGILDK